MIGRKPALLESAASVGMPRIPVVVVYDVCAVVYTFVVPGSVLVVVTVSTVTKTTVTGVGVKVGVTTTTTVPSPTPLSIAVCVATFVAVTSPERVTISGAVSPEGSITIGTVFPGGVTTRGHCTLEGPRVNVKTPNPEFVGVCVACEVCPLLNTVFIPD